MDKRITVSCSKAKYFSLVVLVLLTSWFVIRYASNPLIYVVTDTAWILLITGFVLVQTRSFEMSGNGKIIVLAGYFVRIGVALYGTYGTDALSEWLRGGDQGGFLRVGLQYFQGDFSEYYTRYPFVVYRIFQVMGPERIMVQVVNVLCWFLGIMVLLSVSNGLHGKRKMWLLILYTFLPNALLLSTSFLRESIISLFSMLCFMYIWKWMNCGRIEYMIMVLPASLLPVILHSGNIALLIAAFFIYMRWDAKEGKWKKPDERWIAMLLCVFIAVLFYENVLVRFLMDYLPAKLSWEAIISRTYIGLNESGRAGYLLEAVPSNLGEFVVWSIRQMAYFWISPTPEFWSLPLDIIGFLFDAVPMAFLILWILQCVRRNKGYSRSLAGLYIVIVYTAIYGLGTINAGTAMRHRDQLLGIMVMAALLDMDRKVDNYAGFSYQDTSGCHSYGAWRPGNHADELLPEN